MEDERRRTPSLPFAATAEVIGKGTQTGVPAPVTEPSLFGSYLEISNPLETATQGLFKVYTEARCFETHGIAGYSQPDQGMGVGFQNVNPRYLTVSKQWLIEAALAKFGKWD